jgi:hypothetical protein
MTDCDVPDLSHCCGCAPAQDKDCGTHRTQVPVCGLHAGVSPEQAAPAFCHFPSAQVCGWSPLQVIAPGAQAPSQAAELPVWTQVASPQGAGAPQSPVSEQVSTPLLMHCWAPGVHDPAQPPSTHAMFMQTSVPMHADSVPSVRHETVPGAQKPFPGAPPSASVLQLVG